MGPTYIYTKNNEKFEIDLAFDYMLSFRPAVQLIQAESSTGQFHLGVIPTLCLYSIYYT